MTIHNITENDWKGTKWCVPSAISLLTGRPLFETHQLAAYLTNRRLDAKMDLYVEECAVLLGEYGYRMEPINLAKKYRNNKCGVTVRRFVGDLNGFEKVMPIIFFSHNHAMVTHMGYVADNSTLKPVHPNDFVSKNALVVEAYIVMKSMKVQHK